MPFNIKISRYGRLPLKDVKAKLNELGLKIVVEKESMEFDLGYQKRKRQEEEADLCKRRKTGNENSLDSDPVL